MCMAKFKCKNCGYVFTKFCDKLEDSLDVECTQCKSHWVETIFEDKKKDRFIFPTLPYSDPPYPKPWIGDPMAPQRFRYWCGKSYNNLSDCAVFSREMLG